MGAPKRNKPKFEKPKNIWNLARINADNELLKEYGLKNMKELWKVQSDLSKLRNNVRLLLSGTGSDSVANSIITRLVKLGVIPADSTLEKLLDLNESAFLSRRLQSVVFKKGLARSIKQARQLVVHGFISINGKKVNKPGYMVKAEEELKIGYYKPIEVTPVSKPSEGTSAASGAKPVEEAEQQSAAESAGATA